MSVQNGNRKGSISGQPLYHIKDLEYQSTLDLNPNTTITNLITDAENSLQQAISLLDRRKPDVAYAAYLRSYEILVGCVPRNLLYPDFKVKRGNAYNRFISLSKTLQSWHGTFDKVKDQIKHDNDRHGTLPRRRSSTSSQAPPPPTSIASHAARANGSSKNSAVPTDTVNGRTKPPVSPKPDSLRFAVGPRSPATPTAPAEESDLKQRFERLKFLSTSLDTAPAAPRSPLAASTSAFTSPVNTSPMPRSDPRLSVDFSKLLTAKTSKPAGPRAMDGTNGVFLSSALPQAPTPAYHPSRITTDLETPAGARNNLDTGTTPSASSIAFTDSDYVNRSQDSPYSTYSQSRSAISASLAAETRIDAERLYDYLAMFNILIIDVRSRAQFDAGHIFARSVICIEPTAVRKDMSAAHLRDSLVLSPDSELQMFDNRSNYDLILYCDQSTVSDRFMTQPRSEPEYALRYLYEALYVFSEDQALRKPPVFLSGGVDAWINLVGKHALVTSNTVGSQRSSRTVKRIPVPRSESAIHITKRRLRDYNPLDAEEEQQWHERARQESVVIQEADNAEDDNEATQVNTASPFTDTIEEFNKRFPDAASLGHSPVNDRQSAPVPPPKVPLYPDTPQRQEPIIPSIPQRPAPAAPRVSYSGVNERSVSQTKPLDLPAYVPPHLQPANLRLPRTGLVNFGVTCYMNATIQALSATLPLSLFFLDPKYEMLVQCDNWRGSKGVLPSLFANLVRSIWKGGVQSIRPSTLRTFCARLNSEWGIDRQQDAKEFFDFLVDCLHEDLNANYARTPLRALTVDQEIQRERTPKIIVSREEWSRYLHRESSYLTSLFGGQHASRLRCTTCHFTSTTYEAFYSISVEIPRSGKSHIQDCLRSYCAEERLSGDELWKCPRCKKEREATKKITLTRMPQFLVIHFKRFSASRGESAKKVRTPIDFPLTGLDLEPYVLPPPTPSEAQDIARRYGPHYLKTELASTPPYLYDAYAVMRHIGTTLTSGHYTCLARDQARRCWRQYDDTQTRDFDPAQLGSKDKLQNEQAYIVFFQRTKAA